VWLEEEVSAEKQQQKEEEISWWLQSQRSKQGCGHVRWSCNGVSISFWPLLILHEQ
jgi:hypothetical protein